MDYVHIDKFERPIYYSFKRKQQTIVLTLYSFDHRNQCYYGKANDGIMQAWPSDFVKHRCHQLSTSEVFIHLGKKASNAFSKH